MKIFLNESVWDEALKRIEYLFDEFDNIVVAFSGGKDSTVTLELALIVARKKKRLPLKVCFLDQEAEWQATIDCVKEVMYRDEIEPLWLQLPMFLPNSLSQETPFLISWEKGKEWMRPQDPISIKDGIELKPPDDKEAKPGYWYTYFSKAISQMFPTEPVCLLGGIRTEESPTRLVALTHQKTYKHITWGKKLDEKRGQYTFYPIYDWSLSDVWLAIESHGWSYCNIYDIMYRYGVAPTMMRVSNLHHETAVHHLFWLHEVEKETWEALTKRLGGINQAKHIQKKEMLTVKELPFMFKDWKEYRDYLTEKLIEVPEQLVAFKRRWASMDKSYSDMRQIDDLYSRQVNSLLVNDWEGVKLSGFTNSPPVVMYRKWKNGRLDARGLRPSNLKYIPKWAWPEGIEA
jgi:predicted phosphoadenosine phosphosulfate sulfurtransferase